MCAKKAPVVRDNPALWEDVKAAVKAGDKGGKPGQWSARKAQMAVLLYGKAGGGYASAKPVDTSLQRWQGVQKG
ncbi:MAG: hypothetical protein WAZ18_02815 [Alphaproteobacteria bacterium]